MKPLFYSAKARQDMRGILLKIAEDKPQAAMRFVDHLEEHSRILERFPEAGQRGLICIRVSAFLRIVATQSTIGFTMTASPSSGCLLRALTYARIYSRDDSRLCNRSDRRGLNADVHSAHRVCRRSNASLLRPRWIRLTLSRPSTHCVTKSKCFGNQSMNSELILSICCATCQIICRRTSTSRRL